MLSDEIRTRLSQLHARPLPPRREAPASSPARGPVARALSPASFFERTEECHNTSGMHLQLRRPLTDVWQQADSAMELVAGRAAPLGRAPGADRAGRIVPARGVVPRPGNVWLCRRQHLSGRRRLARGRRAGAGPVVRPPLCRRAIRARSLVADRPRRTACWSPSTARALIGRWSTTAARATGSAPARRPK